jgi:hypothetical protein
VIAVGSAARVLALQRLVGNRSVTGVVASGHHRDAHAANEPSQEPAGAVPPHSTVDRALPPGAAPLFPVAKSESARLVLQRQVGTNVVRHKDRWGALNSPAVLGLWAKDAGMQKLKVAGSLRTLQEAPGTEKQVVKALQAKLLRALHDPQEFDGSPEARRDAAEALMMRWDWIAPPLMSGLQLWYERQFAQALARAPMTAELEARPTQMRRIRDQPYGQEAFSGRHGEMLKIGRAYGPRVIVDIKGSNVKDPTTEIWFYLHPHKDWYYLVSGTVDQYDWFLQRVAGQVAANTQFAAELFPLLLKIAGFSLGLSSRLSVMVASEVVSALGEQGLAAARGGTMKSGWEVLQSAALGLFVGQVTNRMFGRASETPLASGVEQVVEHSAAKGHRIVAATDAGEVEAALRAGRARSVEDTALRAKGYRTEVDVVSEGQAHTWRQKADAGWCRFSDDPLCVGSLGDEVTAAARQHPPDVTVDLKTAGVSQIAQNRAGRFLSLDALVAKYPNVGEISTGWQRVTRAAARGDDELRVHLASEYGLSNYIRYHIRAPGLGRESYPIPLAPTWMNHGANGIEAFMRSQLAKGRVVVSFQATRTTFSGAELRAYLETLLRSGNPEILGRLANDYGRIERFLKRIVYDVRVQETVGSRVRLSYYQATMETGLPPTGAVVHQALPLTQVPTPSRR